MLVPSKLSPKNSYIGVNGPTLKVGPTLDFLKIFFALKKEKPDKIIALLKVMLLKNWEQKG